MAKQFGVSMSDLSPEPVADGPKIVDSETRSIMTINFEPALPDVRYSRIPGQQSAIGESDDEAISVMRRVGRQLSSLAQAQRTMLNLLETQTATHETELEKAIASLGFDPADFTPSEKAGAVASLGDALGGPLVRLAAFNPDAPLNSEERQVMRISALADMVNSYVEGLKLLPIRTPLEAIGRVASGFGPRRDPFTGVSAMHQGIDYPQPSGTPVRATAGGEVKRAGWGGAYGRLIEIVHDNGVSTRYAHLSKIEVKVGDRIDAGQKIGLVGSTGRSTGSHLHYETRVNGNAVNPVKFLRVGSYVFK